MDRLELSAVRIEKENWGANAGQYLGEISFRGPHANVQLKIPHGMCQLILDMCAEQIMEVSQQIAVELRADAIESMSRKD